MESYDNHISGIRSYEVHEEANAIAVVFKGGNEVFVFEGKKVGKNHFEKMEQLAQSNDGLGRYLSKNQEVRKNFTSMYTDASEYKKLYKPSMH